MKKILVCLTVAFVSLSCVPKELQEKRKMCQEMEIVLCAKVATCSVADYNRCKEEFDPLSRCEVQDILEVDLCKQELGNLHCDEDLPASCLKLN